MTDGLYLGKDPQGGQTVAIPPDRLRTHGVVVGMTGSGKTGLCLVMLEELVRAGVPVIAIDPKGDLGNLGLLFPAMQPDDYAPWCGDDDPAAVARSWQQGVLRSGLTAAQVGELRSKMALTVYTPGSTAGVPVDLLGILKGPDAATRDDPEARGELVAGTVSGLLGLAGRKSDPVKDPAHVVLSHILDQAWASGEAVDLATLVLKLVDPPFEKVGVFPVDRFFPPDDRMDLAMAFNAILAAPSFSVWSQGAALEPERMFAQGDKTPVSVFSIAHLDEGQRHFFVGLLLSKLLAWSRRQPGTDDLRAVVFFDEVAGYLPPHPANPPTKAPLLTMMKQARAVGLGVLLATQNPVDLDYKALSNAGLWCIGRLTTEQDRARLLKGLEAEGLAPTVAGLEKRQFLLHQVGRGAPEVFGTRHAMCYLRGPLTRPELGRLNALWGAEAPPPSTEETRAPGSAASQPAVAAGSSVPPTVPGVESYFLDPRVAFSARMEGAFDAHAEARREDGKTLFAPALYADLNLRFDEDRVGFIVDRRLARVFFPLEDRLPDEPMPVRVEAQDLLPEAPKDALFAPLPTWMDEAKELSALQKRVLDDVFRTESEGMFANKTLKLYGRAGETEAEFRARCEAEVQAAVDDEVAKLKDKFEAKADKIQDRLSDKEKKLAEQESLARSRQLEEAVNIGSTILSFFGGRKKSLGSAVTKRRQSAQAGARADQTEAEIERLKADAEALEADLMEEVEAIETKHKRALDDIETKEVRLEKTDIRVEAFGVLWVPVTRRV
ncbi:MAG: DUF853 family protein [Deltaproteobacteria bacterium]|nr:DUF853 family protein [Deltaproteobacteria bacterium]